MALRGSLNLRNQLNYYKNSNIRLNSNSEAFIPSKKISKVPIPGVKNVILVASAKGGVGKSSISVNLALSLRQKFPEKHIGLLDCDVFGPSIPTLLGLEGLEASVNSRKMFVPLQNFGLKIMSMGCLIPSHSAVIWRGLMVMSAVKQLLFQIDWGPLDYLIIDTPPGTGDVHLSIAQNIVVNGVIIVTTPQRVAVSDTRRGIQMFKTLNVPILGVVENMSHLNCPNCNYQIKMFEKDNEKQSIVADLIKETNLKLISKVPWNPEFTVCGDINVPFVIKYPNCKLSNVFTNLAEITEEFCYKESD